MPMAEGAAAYVLPCEPHSDALRKERSDREVFGGAPIDRLALLKDIPLLIEDKTLETRVRFEAIGETDEPAEDLFELFCRHGGRGLGRIGIGASAIALPKTKHPGRHQIVTPRFRFGEGLLERVLFALRHLLSLFDRDRAELDELRD